MDGRPDLSLVIACYNEEPVLEDSIGRIFETLDWMKYSYEIIFVDDCSHDRTRELIDRIIFDHPSRRLSRILHEKNVGRGGTVVDGIRQARGEVVGYVDIDLEVPAHYIPACVIAVKNGADVAVGLRIYRFQLRSIDRYVLSKGYQWLVRRGLNVNGLTDSESGFKFFRRERILPILDLCQDRGWFWDTEVMVWSALRGYRIVEIPVLFLRRFDKRSSVRVVHDTFDYLVKLWRFRQKLSHSNRSGF